MDAKKGLTFSLFAVLVVMAMPMAFADTISSASFTLASSSPVITQISLDGLTDNSHVENPVESTTTTVEVNMTVTDIDGVGDLNDSAQVCGVQENSDIDDITSWSTADTSATVRVYSADLVLNYNVTPGTKTVNCSAYDVGGLSDNDNTHSFTYGSLASISLSETTLSFGSLASNSSDNAATENPEIITVTGNVNVNISINASDFVGVTNSTYVIGAGNITMDDDATASEGVETDEAEVAMSASSYIDVNPTISVNGQDNFYFFLDIPANFGGLPWLQQSYQATNWDVLATVG